jgi:hypothetical protein
MQLRCSYCEGCCRGRRQGRRSRDVPFLAIDFLVSLQWVPVFSGCQSSVGASLQWVPVFSGCQSSVGASFSQAEVSIRGCCRGVEVAVEVFKAAIEVLRPPSRCRGCR